MCKNPSSAWGRGVPWRLLGLELGGGDAGASFSENSSGGGFTVRALSPAGPSGTILGSQRGSRPVGSSGPDPRPVPWETPAPGVSQRALAPRGLPRTGPRVTSRLGDGPGGHLLRFSIPRRSLSATFRFVSALESVAHGSCSSVPPGRTSPCASG